jgi:hypothetical protein
MAVGTHRLALGARCEGNEVGSGTPPPYLAQRKVWRQQGQWWNLAILSSGANELARGYGQDDVGSEILLPHLECIVTVQTS